MRARRGHVHKETRESKLYMRTEIHSQGESRDSRLPTSWCSRAVRARSRVTTTLLKHLATSSFLGQNEHYLDSRKSPMIESKSSSAPSETRIGFCLFSVVLIAGYHSYPGSKKVKGVMAQVRVLRPRNHHEIH